MTYQLRPYQKEAVEAILDHFRASTDRACVVLPTGAGKSLVIAELCRVATGRVLVLAHVKELCEQNYHKFRALAPQRSAGLFSAGLGEKNHEAAVTFGSVQSVAPHLARFTEPFSLLIIDECHRLSLDETSQYAQILTHFLGLNSKLRVLGLTATPYRLGLGFCYQRHALGMVRSEEAKPFVQCVYEVTLKRMIAEGYLTPPTLVDAPIAHYDFSGVLAAHTALEPETRAVNALLVRHKRVTQAIVEQIVEWTETQQRRGVMIFAATVEHAQEIMSYLPEQTAGLVIGATDSSTRDETISRFLQQQLRYLVNVAVLTTGFDAPHVDFIALLRATQSVSLYQQIVGRGLRLFPAKKDCLVVDYAGNGYNLFSPEIGESRPHAGSEVVEVCCPECTFNNQFWGIKDEEGHVLEHYGRRCTAFLSEQQQRCSYRFRFKECPQCTGENDIAARRCAHCDHVLIDPDDLLKNALSLKDALVLRVSGVEYVITNNRLTLVYHDEDGAHVKEHFDFDSSAQRAIFNRVFSRRLAGGRRPLELTTAAQAAQLGPHMPRPDFVVARAQKRRGRTTWYKIQERVFDYAGAYRKAAPADGSN